MSARSYGEFEFWFASSRWPQFWCSFALAAAYAAASPLRRTDVRNLSATTASCQGLVAVSGGRGDVYFSLTGAEITTIAAAEVQEPARAVAEMSSSVSCAS